MAPLASLRLLKLHLDFPWMPRPKIGGSTCIGVSVSPEEALRINTEPRAPSFDDVLDSAAEELSQKLALSLEEVWMFRYDYDPEWLLFAVTRGVGLDGRPHVDVVQAGVRKY